MQVRGTVCRRQYCARYARHVMHVRPRFSLLAPRLSATLSAKTCTPSRILDRQQPPQISNPTSSLKNIEQNTANSSLTCTNAEHSRCCSRRHPPIFVLLVPIRGAYDRFQPLKAKEARGGNVLQILPFNNCSRARVLGHDCWHWKENGLLNWRAVDEQQPNPCTGQASQGSPRLSHIRASRGGAKSLQHATLSWGVGQRIPSGQSTSICAA
ncbi:hypothetical protein C8035_v004300 [Colletotrichum spinosum]|uniref:Uncharacterized protein n=1 Tax=Colletotrichum spinosum TaxID=1347390 RepID=A0A4R8PM04_9PEZI|nr:hypothetical protein C8035_v004300 [Colletotrichum spinosum]